jgi:predicted transcriptional regulator
VNRINREAEEKANTQRLFELANKLKEETERIAREALAKAEAEKKRIQDEINKGIEEAKRIKTIGDEIKRKVEEEARRIADEVNRIKKISEDNANAKRLLDLANQLKEESERIARETLKKADAERRRIQDEIDKKLVKPTESVIKNIQDIPKLITVDLRDKITKDLPKVLMPIAIDVMKKLMPKPKKEDEGNVEFGYYQDADGTMWVKDETGFHRYYPDDPVYSQDTSGVWWVDDKTGHHIYIFPEPQYFQDQDGNYWVDNGDGKGYVRYIPEIEQLANGFYQDENGDYWEQSDAGLNRYTPEMETLAYGYYQNKVDGRYWVQDKDGFRLFTE